MTRHRHLVLGGDGFIGRHLAARLARAGDDVIVAGRSLNASSFEAPHPSIRAICLDLASADWPGLVAGADFIHHCAWASIPQSANADPLADLTAHVEPTLRLFEAMRRNPGKQLIFLSSGGTVYGRLEAKPASERDELRPASLYAAGKLAVESYCRAYHAMGVLDASIVRLSNPYGVGQDIKRNQGLISAFVYKALAGEPLTIWGDGSAVRDFLHISDVSDALARLTRISGAQRTDDPLVVNIGSGVGISINQVVQHLETALCLKLEVAYGPGRSFDLPFNVLDAANLPDAPAFPNPFVFAGGGFALGLLLGLGVAALLEYRDTSLRNERDIWAFTKLPTLAVISRIKDLPQRDQPHTRWKLFSRTHKPVESAL